MAMPTTSKRSAIVNAIVDLLKTVDGTSQFKSNLFENVKNKLLFWDEVPEYPYVSVVSGPERREYLPGGFKWGYLRIRISIMVKQEDPKAELELIFDDVETLLDANNNLPFGTTNDEVCADIRIISISDDEGLLYPMGVGEMIIQVQYPILT